MGDQPFDADPRRIFRADRWGSPLRLDEVPTRRRLQFSGKKARGQRLLAERAEVLAEAQERLWAHQAAAGEPTRRAVMERLVHRAPSGEASERDRPARLLTSEVTAALAEVSPGPRVLLVLQGMDASGKGGTVKHVVGSMDPLGVSVTGFGRPTEAERREHFLRRIIRRLPAPGHVGVLDRSHYEDVLVPAVTGTLGPEALAERTEVLRLFEEELVRRGIAVVKVFLHLSPQEQLERLLSRLDRPEKHWKYDPSDADARADFGLFRTVYSGLLQATDTDWAPWHVVPADRKWYSRLAVQELLISTLEDLELGWPRAGFDIETERQRLLSS
ncbi:MULTISPECIES: PPK2 family polyphosphate kinase [Actinomycetes]|uniref:Polyphosphate kinase-2-related domain-containing protein n=2 Tax=Actinomycetes TaxID=1760 RepID=A0ABP6M4R7_9MICC